MSEQTREYTFQNVTLDDGTKGRVRLKVTLRDGDTDKPEFSVMGFFYERRHRLCSFGGQCLDELSESTLRQDASFCEIYRLWKCYHLNGMHAGTPKQENVIDIAKKSGELPSRASYEELIGCLKRYGVYEDDGYRYGSSWLYQPIPTDDLTIIRKLVA